MNQNEIKELVAFLAEKDIAEFEMERGDVKLRIKRAQAVLTAPLAASYPAPAAAPAPPPQAVAAAAAAAAPAASAPEKEEGIAIIKSPIVGTFYEAASPGSPAFVKEGDNVAVGQVLCIVEAMKLMNEIESDAAGQIVKILVSNGQPVEYGQPLFKVRTR
ncbi:MAG: acetyl-CoA carboxylase biotin carboxyl carrier protein [Candidatus Korobacteraceae bacterium]